MDKLHFANKTAQEQYAYSQEEFMLMNELDLNPNFSKSSYQDLWEKAKKELLRVQLLKKLVDLN